MQVLGLTRNCTCSAPWTTDKCEPLQYNMDALNGVSFSKGCYIGQEKNSFTRYRGIIRRRCMPFRVLEGPGEPKIVFNECMWHVPVWLGLTKTGSIMYDEASLSPELERHLHTQFSTGGPWEFAFCAYMPLQETHSALMTSWVSRVLESEVWAQYVVLRAGMAWPT